MNKLRLHFKTKHKSDTKKIREPKKKKQTTITDYYDNDEEAAMQHLVGDHRTDIKEVFS